MENSLTVDRVRQFLQYDPETGMFHWLASNSPRVKIGDQAGSVTQGYKNVQLDGALYRAHRLAWLHVYGEWPKRRIDHINGNGLDNRLCNLREASQSQNVANARRKITCKSGFKGVTAHGSRWVASIGRAGRKMHLGVFDTPELAHAAYMSEAERRYGEFARAA